MTRVQLLVKYGPITILGKERISELVDMIKTAEACAEDHKDATEFEAIVASKLTRLDAEDLPCANSMGIFCPRPPFRGRNCGPWCLLRMARLEVESGIEEAARRAVAAGEEPCQK